MLKGKLHFNLKFLDQLFKSAAPPLIGCDISSSSAKLVEIAEVGRKLYRVERYAIEPLPHDAVVDRPLTLSLVTEPERPHKRDLRPAIR